MKNILKQTPATSRAARDISRSYNVHKEHDGKHHTGMQVSHSHKWNYDKGVWREIPIGGKSVITLPSEELAGSCKKLRICLGYAYLVRKSIDMHHLYSAM